MPAVNADLKTHLDYQASNIRKPQFGGVFVGDWPSADPVTTLTATGGQVALPDSYESVGRISEDGVTVTRDMEMSETRGWGSSSILRRDVESLDVSVQFSMLETRLKAYEISMGLNLSALTMSAAGEFKVDMPTLPQVKYWRVLLLAADGVGDSRYYFGKWFPKMTLSEIDDETFSQGDDPVMRNVTLGSDVDDEAGGMYTEFLFGPGALAAAERMGITVAGT
jgi:hypothetical protein